MPTQQEISTFLAPAIEGAKTLLFDQQVADQQIDGLLSVLSSIALSQLEAWLQRPLVLSANALVDRYPIPKKVGGPIELRAVPVAQVTKVEYELADPAGTFEELSQGQDWKLEGSMLYVPGLSSIRVPMWDESPCLRVTYRGGYSLSSNNPVIHSALIQQIVGLYNTRTYIGYAYAGGSKAVKVDLDVESGLFRQVMFLVESEVYRGNGGPW